MKINNVPQHLSSIKFTMLWERILDKKHFWFVDPILEPVIYNDGKWCQCILVNIMLFSSLILEIVTCKWFLIE